MRGRCLWRKRKAARIRSCCGPAHDAARSECKRTAKREPCRRSIEKIAGDTDGVILRVPGLPHQGQIERSAVGLSAGGTACRRAAGRRRDRCADAASCAPRRPKGVCWATSRSCPSANPIGRAQYLFGDQQGRFHLGTRTNFNREFPADRQAGCGAAAARRRAAEGRPAAQGAAGDTVDGPRHRARPALRRRGRAVSLRAGRAVARPWPTARRRSASRRCLPGTAMPTPPSRRRRSIPISRPAPTWRGRVVTTVELRGIADVERGYAQRRCRGPLPPAGRARRHRRRCGDAGGCVRRRGRAARQCRDGEDAEGRRGALRRAARRTGSRKARGWQRSFLRPARRTARSTSSRRNPAMC